MLRVTNLHLRARAVAAMIESKAAMDLPCVSVCTVIGAQTSEAFWSNAKIRSSKPASNCSSQVVNS